MRYTHVSESAYLDKEGKNYLMLIERNDCKMKYQVVISNELGMQSIEYHSSSLNRALKAFANYALRWSEKNSAVPVPVSSLPLENITEDGLFIYPTVIINFWRRMIICLLQDSQDEMYKIDVISFDSEDWYKSKKVLLRFPRKHSAIYYYITHYLESNSTYKVPYDDFSVEQVEEMIAAMDKIMELIRNKMYSSNILNEEQYLCRLELLDMQQTDLIIKHHFTWEMVEAYRNGLILRDLDLLIEKKSDS